MPTAPTVTEAQGSDIQRECWQDLKTAIAKNSMLSVILKDSERLLSAFNDGNFAPQQKRMWMAVCKDMENSLLTWMRRTRSSNLEVNSVVVPANAGDVALCLNIEFAVKDG